MNTIVSPDAKRAVTLHTLAETLRTDASGNLRADNQAIVPSTKRKHVVAARTATGGIRTWQVTSKKVAERIRSAYRANGGSALVTQTFA